MAEPTKKNPEIEKLITKVSGTSRIAAIKTNRCINPPIGCGKPAEKFRDKLSETEFTISGFCQNCQDSLFGK